MSESDVDADQEPNQITGHICEWRRRHPTKSEALFALSGKHRKALSVIKTGKEGEAETYWLEGQFPSASPFLQYTLELYPLKGDEERRNGKVKRLIRRVISVELLESPTVKILGQVFALMHPICHDSAKEANALIKPLRVLQNLEPEDDALPLLMIVPNKKWTKSTMVTHSYIRDVLLDQLNKNELFWQAASLLPITFCWRVEQNEELLHDLVKMARETPHHLLFLEKTIIANPQLDDLLSWNDYILLRNRMDPPYLPLAPLQDVYAIYTCLHNRAYHLGDTWITVDEATAMIEKQNEENVTQRTETAIRRMMDAGLIVRADEKLTTWRQRQMEMHWHLSVMRFGASDDMPSRIESQHVLSGLPTDQRLSKYVGGGIVGQLHDLVTLRHQSLILLNIPWAGGPIENVYRNFVNLHRNETMVATPWVNRVRRLSMLGARAVVIGNIQQNIEQPKAISILVIEYAHEINLENLNQFLARFKHLRHLILIVDPLSLTNGVPSWVGPGRPVDWIRRVDTLRQMERAANESFDILTLEHKVPVPTPILDPAVPPMLRKIPACYHAFLIYGMNGMPLGALSTIVSQPVDQISPLVFAQYDPEKDPMTKISDKVETLRMKFKWERLDYVYIAYTASLARDYSQLICPQRDPNMYDKDMRVMEWSGLAAGGTGSPCLAELTGIYRECHDGYMAKLLDKPVYGTDTLVDVGLNVRVHESMRFMRLPLKSLEMADATCVSVRQMAFEKVKMSIVFLDSRMTRPMLSRILSKTERLCILVGKKSTLDAILETPLDKEDSMRGPFYIHENRFSGTIDHNEVEEDDAEWKQAWDKGAKRKRSPSRSRSSSPSQERSRSGSRSPSPKRPRRSSSRGEKRKHSPSRSRSRSRSRSPSQSQASKRARTVSPSSSPKRDDSREASDNE